MNQHQLIRDIIDFTEKGNSDYLQSFSFEHSLSATFIRVSGVNLIALILSTLIVLSIPAIRRDNNTTQLTLH